MLACLLQSVFELLKIVKAPCFVQIPHRGQTVGPSDTSFNAFGGGYIQSSAELRTHGCVDSIFRSTSARTHATGFDHSTHGSIQCSLRGPTSTPS